MWFHGEEEVQRCLEALSHIQMQEYVDSCVLTYLQYAYTKGRGTGDAIAVVAAHCAQVRDAIDSQRLTLQARHTGANRSPCVGGGQLALDFSRDFDTMPRS